MSAAVLKLGSLEIPVLAGLDLEQTYEPIGGETTLRTMTGAGLRQQTWRRTRTTISGSGWIPPGLSALDNSASIAIACIAPQAIMADGARQATLPAARRADAGHLPYGFALTDTAVVATPVSLAGNVATATAVTGATAYQINYFPLLTCWLDPPTASFSRADGSHRWEITAEEV